VKRKGKGIESEALSPEEERGEGLAVYGLHLTTEKGRRAAASQQKGEVLKWREKRD